MMCIFMTLKVAADVAAENNCDLDDPTAVYTGTWEDSTVVDFRYNYALYSESDIVQNLPRLTQLSLWCVPVGGSASYSVNIDLSDDSEPYEEVFKVTPA